MSELLPFEEAQRRLIAMAQPLDQELRPVADAAGCYLAAPVVSQRTQPAADLSAMDGYAVSGDEPWALVGESRAGRPFAGGLARNQAVRISTGAMLPSGAERILIQENAAINGGVITAPGGMPASGRHIRRKGFDFSEADQVLDNGVMCKPPQIALALSSGVSDVLVHRKPTIAIIDSGDELITDPASCASAQIPASNGAMIAAMARDLTSIILQLGPVPDRLEALTDAFSKAWAADVVVTSGGASVGDHDLIRPALEAWGAQIDFFRIAMRPGKPLLVATRGKQIILGLPGNPVSSFVTAHFFLLPLLRALAGGAEPFGVSVGARLVSPLPAGGPRLNFVRAIYQDRYVTPLDEQDSSALLALSEANALIERPAGCTVAHAGEEVHVHLL